MTQYPDYTIRTMTRPEVDFAIEWAAREGWNPGLGDAECFYNTDPAGFLIGLLGNKPVGAVSAVRYGSSFGFIGLYIVLPEHRGTGLGFRLGRSALKRLRGRTIGLDGVLERKENYRQIGFEFAYSNMRFEGFGGGEHFSRHRVRSLSELHFDELVAYDQPFFPDERKTFLECWIQQPGCTALGVIDHDRLAGYGIIRSCRKGYKIGPLFADRPDLAEELFSALKASVPDGTPIYLDIPEVNSFALELVKRHNMKVVFKTARMYKGVPPELPVERIFGITTFELG